MPFTRKREWRIRRAFRLAEERGDDYFAGRGHAGIANIYLDTIQPGLADPYLMNAILLAEKSDKTSELEMKLLKRQFAENLVNVGKAADAAKWVDPEIHDECDFTGRKFGCEDCLTDRTITGSTSNLGGTRRQFDIAGFASRNGHPAFADLLDDRRK